MVKGLFLGRQLDVSSSIDNAAIAASDAIDILEEGQDVFFEEPSHYDEQFGEEQQLGSGYEATEYVTSSSTSDRQHLKRSKEKVVEIEDDVYVLEDADAHFLTGSSRTVTKTAKSKKVSKDKTSISWIGPLGEALLFAMLYSDAQVSSVSFLDFFMRQPQFLNWRSNLTNRNVIVNSDKLSRKVADVNKVLGYVFDLIITIQNTQDYLDIGLRYQASNGANVGDYDENELEDLQGTHVDAQLLERLPPTINGLFTQTKSARKSASATESRENYRVITRLLKALANKKCGPKDNSNVDQVNRASLSSKIYSEPMHSSKSDLDRVCFS